MMTFTVRAAAQAVKGMLELDSRAIRPLRISVKGGGCSGMSYQMEPGTPTKGDKVIEYETGNDAVLTVLVDPKSWLFLQGVTVDFEGGLNGRGFTYSNPSAKRVCGCGTSFSA